MQGPGGTPITAQGLGIIQTAHYLTTRGMIHTEGLHPVTAPRQPAEWSRRALAVGGGGPPAAGSTRANLLQKTAFTTWTGVRAREKACILFFLI